MATSEQLSHHLLSIPNSRSHSLFHDSMRPNRNAGFVNTITMQHVNLRAGKDKGYMPTTVRYHQDIGRGIDQRTWSIISPQRKRKKKEIKSVMVPHGQERRRTTSIAPSRTKRNSRQFLPGVAGSAVPIIVQSRSGGYYAAKAPTHVHHKP